MDPVETAEKGRMSPAGIRTCPENAKDGMRKICFQNSGNESVRVLAVRCRELQAEPSGWLMGNVGLSEPSPLLPIHRNSRTGLQLTDIVQ